MQIFPAIDLRGGQVVRLYQGDYDRETVYAADPCAVARSFLAAGARYLHVVDLDGAKDGKPKTVYIYNICDHEACYREGGSQAISYTPGVPAMIGGMMLLTGKWYTPGG